MQIAGQAAPPVQRGLTRRWRPSRKMCRTPELPELEFSHFHSLYEATLIPRAYHAGRQMACQVISWATSRGRRNALSGALIGSFPADGQCARHVEATNRLRGGLPRRMLQCVPSWRGWRPLVRSSRRRERILPASGGRSQGILCKLSAAPGCLRARSTNAKFFRLLS